MVSVTFAECTFGPLVPVMVKGYVPVATFLLVEIWSVEVLDPVIDDGLNVLFANFGRPVTDRLTVPEPATVTV
jgi:hypothetical protein